MQPPWAWSWSPGAVRFRTHPRNFQCEAFYGTVINPSVWWPHFAVSLLVSTCAGEIEQQGTGPTPGERSPNPRLALHPLAAGTA